MEGLNPQVKRKILSDNPRRFYLDLNHPSLLKRYYFSWDRLNRVFRFAIYRSSHYSPILSALDSNVKSKERDPIDSSADL